MSSRFVMGMVTMCRVGTLLAAAALLGGCAPASAQTKVLIYSDQSAGSLMMSSANRHAEIAGGAAVTFTTDATRMPSLTDGDNWERILVFARWTAQEPAYVHNLRQFAFGKPQAMVYMELWHDDGRTISPQVCVKASVAMTKWNRNVTLIKYGDVTDTGSGTGDGMRVFDGQVWPTWQDIIPRRPEGITLLPPEANEHRDTFDLHDWMASRTDCAAQCQINFNVDKANCDQRHAENVAACHTLHSGNPAKLVECLNKFGQHHSNCLKEAADRHDLCVAMCPNIDRPMALPGGGVTN